MELPGYSKDLLILYEDNGEEWAMYMNELFLSAHNKEICLYNLNSEFDEMFVQTHQSYQCKILVLTKYLLKSLTEEQSTRLTRLLHPSQNVAILLCGVQRLDEFYDQVPLNRDSQIFHTDQDPQHYISVVSGILNEDYTDIHEQIYWNTPDSLNEDTTMKNTDSIDIPKLQIPSALVLPRRILCEAPGKIYIVLIDEIPNNVYVEVEFCTEKLVIRKPATQWNEKILCVTAPDLPAGPVSTNIWHGDIIKASTQIEYYTAIGEIERLLSKAIDPIVFICQAFNVYSLEDLDMVLMKSLQRRMSSCEFSLHEIIQHTNSGSSEEIPTLLHCAAKYGLKEVTLLLMHCQGADQISKITNKYGDDPAKIAAKHGYSEVQEIIHQLTRKTKSSDDTEHLNPEPEEDYVDMVPHPGAETYDNGSKECTFCGKREISHKQSSEQVENDQGYSQYEDSAEDFRAAGHADNPLDIMKDERNSEGTNLFWGDAGKNEEEEKEQKNPKSEFLSSSDTDDENMFLPLLFENEREQVQNVYQMLTTGLPPSDDATIFVDVKDRLMLEDSQGRKEESINKPVSWNDQDKLPTEETDNENEEPPINASANDDLYILYEPSEQNHTAQEPDSHSALICGSCTTPGTIEETTWENLCSVNLEYPDEGNVGKLDEEPLVVATFEEDEYISFQTSTKDTIRCQPSSIPECPIVPDQWGISGFASSGSYTDQDYIDEINNQHLSWDEDTKYPEEGKRDEIDDDPHVVATTDDDVYIVFQTSVKNEPRDQPYLTDHHSMATDAPFKTHWESQWESGAFNIEKDYIDEINHQHLSWDEDTKYPEEGKRDEIDDDLHVVATTDDDVYIAFQTSVKNKPRDQPYLTDHHSMAADATFKTNWESQWESGAFSIDKGVKEKSNPVETCWDETTDEYTYNESDPYSVAHEDDENVYMEFPFDNSDTADKRDGKSLIFQRAPAPAPRVEVPTQESNASYISQVFHQKPEEKKLYSTLTHPVADRMSPASRDSPIPFQPSLPTGQDELILLQEKVKLGIISMDEALHKFQLWQNEKAGLDLLQQKKLRQLRDSIIGDKPEDEVYGEISQHN
uniref:DBB domain-containing protein n=1 Tax=Leptobrachium leishanense TaxID=445787 RepID=A0A8C5WAW7_9ANUR